MALRVGDQTIDELTVTDSRIEPGIRKIDNEIDQDEHSHNEYDESLDSVVVPIQYRICLLYTSPSPRDLSTSRMPSSA